MPEKDSRRARLPVRRAVAFCPGAITNFFSIHYGPTGQPDGATGGGYVLSKGTVSKATFHPASGQFVMRTVVNGDPGYNARTTRRALRLLAASRFPVGTMVMDQKVDTPIGSGFGASGGSATSAVYAASAALGIRMPKDELAFFAHQAEIIEQTGLGTVSVVYRGAGAGAIITPGEPGVAKFLNVKIPRDLRIVTAYLAPYDKRDAIASGKMSERIGSLGEQALASFIRDPTIETLASEGERFSQNLGLETPEVKKLISVAKASGAFAASQIMIGYAIHALTDSDRSHRLERALKRTSPEARVDVFTVGQKHAGLVVPSRS